MCTSQRPEHGADAGPIDGWVNDQPIYSDGTVGEPIDRFDQSCDLCGRIAWDGSLRAETHAGTTLWKCAACREQSDARFLRMTGGAA